MQSEALVPRIVMLECPHERVQHNASRAERDAQLHIEGRLQAPSSCPGCGSMQSCDLLLSHNGAAMQVLCPVLLYIRVQRGESARAAQTNREQSKSATQFL